MQRKLHWGMWLTILGPVMTMTFLVPFFTSLSLTLSIPPLSFHSFRSRTGKTLGIERMLGKHALI